MARDPKRLRKAYEVKIGKDLVGKLSDEQIGLLSGYYNSLSEQEQSDIDNRIFKGYSDTELHEIAQSFAEENTSDQKVATKEKPPEPKGGSLVVFEGKAEEDLVDEEIDETILRAIGLDDVFDIDYGTYISLLKEKMVADRMGQKLETGEAEAVTKEYQRVKRKTGRFKIKKQKIDLKKTREKKTVNGIKLLKPAKLDTETADEKLKSPKSKISKDDKLLKSILDNVKAIHQIIKDRFKFTKKTNEDERKYLERQKRSEREKNLEKKKEGNKFLQNLKSSLPKFSFLDTLFNFIKNVILGRIVMDLIKWMADPENKKKLDAVFQFLKDWWPALTAAFIAFATPLGAFIRTVVGGMARLTAYLLKKAIPALIRFAAKNPIAAGLIATGIAGTALAIRSGESADEIIKDRGASDKTNKEKADELSKPFNIMEMFTRMALPSLNTPVQAKSGGGLVQGFDEGGIVTSILSGLGIGGRVISPKGLEPHGLGTSSYTVGGIKIPGSEQTHEYSREDAERYNALHPTRNLVSTYPGGRGFTKTIPKPGQRNEISDAFANFGSNVRTITGAARRQEEMMRELGYEPDGYYNIFGQPTKGSGYSGGGKVKNILGYSGGGFGTDTVPAMLTPGEFVMSKGAVDKFGVGTMMAMNRAGGGTNRPKLISGLTLAAGGGPVYGESLKFKSPIPQYPNYEKPDDYFGQFFRRIYDAAVKAGDPFPEVVAAQACEESNYGKSNLAKHANNLFGQDAPTGANPNDHYPYFDPVEQKHHVGMRFASIEEAVKYRVNTWKKYYGNARTPAEAIRNIAKEGYNPHAPYPGKIDELLRNFGVEPNTPRPFQLQMEQKTNVNVPGQSPGPKGIIESLRDDQGLSRFIPGAIRNLIPGKPQSSISPSSGGGSVRVPGPPASNNISMTELPTIQRVASANRDSAPPAGQDVPQFDSFSASGLETRANKLRSLTGAT